MDENSCTIYVGNFFTLEWYFDEKGYSQPYEYFLSLEKEDYLARKKDDKNGNYI